MCVIMVATTKRPTEDMLRRGYDHNPAGAGVAWRDGKFVQWQKGIDDLEEVLKLCAELPLPFVVHFRIPTVGGKVKELTHPFPVQRDVSLALRGKTDDFVLFHNGHWGSWKNSSLDAAVKNKVKVPGGKWSDSRAMAWSAHLYGVGILEFIDEKAIAFGPDEIEVFGSGWQQVNDIWVSNRNWETGTVRNGSHSPYTTPPFSMAGAPASSKREEATVVMGPAASKKGSGGDRAETPFNQILADFHAGRISKSKFKSLKKAHSARLRKELRKSEREAKRRQRG